MTKRIKLFLFALALASAPIFARATAPVILSINYNTSDLGAIHIGSTITAYMTAIDLGTTGVTLNNITVNASTTTNITLYSPDFATLGAATVYITDGIRTWKFVFAGGASTITLGNANMLAAGVGAFPFSVTDYTSLVNNTFRIYKGTLITGTGPQMNIDLGGFGNVVLYDDGILGADVATDGVWTGRYFVPDLGYSVSGGKFFGQAVLNGVIASNSPFQSAVSFALDGVRPNIETINFSTNRPNYNGVMYLSSLCQGTTTPQPTNAQGRFDVTVNKRDTQVVITLITGPDKKLSTMIIPAGATNLNGWKVWNGDNGDGNFVQDGRYIASLVITDQNGVVGVTKTVQVIVVSLKIDIENITINPPALNTVPAVVDSVLTVITHKVVLQNDSNTGLRSSLVALGWPLSTMQFDSVSDYKSMVYALNRRTFLNPDGSTGIAISNDHDFDVTADEDGLYVAKYATDSKLKVANCYLGAAGLSAPLSTPVNVGDDKWSNDWSPDWRNIFDPVENVPFANANPTLLQGDFSMYVRGSTPAAGSYRLVIRSILTGLEAKMGAASTNSTMSDQCNSTSTTASVWHTILTHWYPSCNPENGDPTSYTGMGVFAENNSIIFSVNANQPATTDTTPPNFLTSDPVVDSIIGPNIYGPSKPLTASVQDIETPINIGSNITFMRLTDPSGGVVGGTSSNNGGDVNNKVSVSFTPFAPIKVGGIYTLTLYACNQGGLCIQKDINFTIQDQTPPDVSGEELVSSASSGTLPLTMFQTSPDGPFNNITEVWATLSVPPTSQNTVDWDKSNISLAQISGGSTINKVLTRLAPVLGTAPSDGKLRYKLTSPITTAGLYKVSVQAFSKDASGNSFSGPTAGFIDPQFNTVQNLSSLNLYYPLNPARLAVSGTLPITVNVGGTPHVLTISNISAVVPVFNTLASNPGYTALVTSAGNAHALQFNFGAGAATIPGTWSYSPGSPLFFTLHYDDADLPSGVTGSSLKLYGYTGTAWQAVPSSQFVQSIGNVNDNTFVIAVPNGSIAYSAYGLFYAAASSMGGSPVVTTTPMPPTRSFNPSRSTARFYYGTVAPKEISVRIYDTAGNLIKSLSLGSGVNLTDTTMDPNAAPTFVQYFFNWDGSNDSGSTVKNGVYLIRYQVSRIDDTSETTTRLVALIR